MKYLCLGEALQSEKNFSLSFYLLISCWCHPKVQGWCSLLRSASQETEEGREGRVERWGQMKHNQSIFKANWMAIDATILKFLLPNLCWQIFIYYPKYIYLESSVCLECNPLLISFINKVVLESSHAYHVYIGRVEEFQEWPHGLQNIKYLLSGFLAKQRLPTPGLNSSFSFHSNFLKCSQSDLKFTFLKLDFLCEMIKGTLY